GAAPPVAVVGLDLPDRVDSAAAQPRSGRCARPAAGPWTGRRNLHSVGHRLHRARAAAALVDLGAGGLFVPLRVLADHFLVDRGGLRRARSVAMDLLAERAAYPADDGVDLGRYAAPAARSRRAVWRRLDRYRLRRRRTVAALRRNRPGKPAGLAGLRYRRRPA